MTTGPDEPAAGFHRAAATVLRDASSPDDVVGALTLVRRVVLGPDAASAEDDEVVAETSSSRALASECAAAAEACAASKNPAAARWTGFDAVGEEMLHAVAPRWLPLMRSERRRALHDEILAAMPPMTAIRVLVPALAPSSTTAGRDLDDAGKTAVATEAARALAAALERGIARRLLSNLEPAEVDEATRLCAALFSAADRLELSPGSHGCAAALHPVALARTVAAQLCDAARHSCAATGDSAMTVAAAALARACRRGAADAVADALLDAVTDSPSTDVARPDWANELIDALPDAHAVAKLAQSFVLRCAARGATWRACERAFRAAFSVRFGRCASTRHAVCDGMLLRRPQPRAMLPALIRVALVDPPRMINHRVNEGVRNGEAEPKAEAKAEAETAARARHRATTAAACVDAWSQLELVRGGSGALQGHVAAVVAASLAAGALIGGSIGVGGGGGGGADVVVTPAALMRGISARLDSPDARTRAHGRKVAVALSRVISPDRPLTFHDDEDFGASDIENGGDVSEDEEAWEAEAWRLGVDGVEEGEEADAEADAFAAAVLGPEAVSGDDEEIDGGPDEEGENDDDDDEDVDDPDGAVKLGGGAIRRADSDTDDDDDEDVDDSSSDASALEPYDISDEDDEETDIDGDPAAVGGAADDPADPAAAAARRLRAARATARRIARLPRPKTLSSCVDALRQARRGDETAASKSSIDRADEAEGAVHAAEALIRAAPEEIIGCAPAMVSALLHAHPATPDPEPLGAARQKALAAMCAVVPGLAGPALAFEAFASGRCDAGQKLEVLDVVADAARELAALPPVPDRDGDARLLGDHSKKPPGQGRKVGRERVFAPASLARLRAGPSAVADAASKPRRTRAHLIGASLAGPLLAGAVEMVRQAEERAFAAAREQAAARANPDAVHVPGGGIDALVLGRTLGCLGECCAAARNAPDAAKIAGAVLELALSPGAMNHAQPHVRRAALFACVGAVTSVPPAAAWHALSGGVGGAAAGSALAGGLAALEDAAGRARVTDPDGDARGLALRVQLSAADLRQRAVAVGTAGGVDPNRADPMYLLKNVSSLMIGDA